MATRSLAHSPIRGGAGASSESKDAGPAGFGATGHTSSFRRGSAGGLPATSFEGGAAAKMTYLQEVVETLTKRVEMERRKAVELDKKIKISRTKLEESRGRMRGVDDVSEARAHAKAVKSVEHRLDIIMSRLNSVNKQNDGLRDVIESLRRDKIQRQRILRRLEREVADATRTLEATTTEAATHAEARDKNEREIAVFQSTIQKEAAAFEATFSARIATFTEAAAARTRAAATGEAARTESAASGTSGGAAGGTSAAADDASKAVRAGVGPAGQAAEETQGSMTVEQEIELKHKSIKTLWEIARREVEVREQSAKLAHLEEAFGKIQESTGITTIDEMVTAFVTAEDRNYAILTMINDLNQEIETAEVENASLRAAVTDARMRGSAGHSSRERLQREWDATIRGMMRQAASYDRQYDAALRSLDAVKPGVHSIFAKLGAGDAAVAESLAAAGVTDGNVMTHLGLIEQRVAELMQMYELAMAGVPLTQLTEEEEAAVAASPPVLSAAGLPVPPTSPKALLDVEISRVGGIGGTDGTFRSRRAVVVVPIPPTIADLEDSDDDDGGAVILAMPSIGLGATGALGASAVSGARRTSAPRAGLATRRSSGGAGGRAGGDEADVSLLEPLDLDRLRAHTIALVERKQAKAERRERLAEHARLAFTDSLPGGAISAAAAYANRGRLSGASFTGGAMGGVVEPAGLGGGSPIALGAAGHSPVASARSSGVGGSGASIRSSTAAAAIGSGGSVASSSRPASSGGGGAAAAAGAAAPTALASSGFMPRPPSQPASRPGAARPGGRRG